MSFTDVNQDEIIQVDVAPMSKVSVLQEESTLTWNNSRSRERQGTVDAAGSCQHLVTLGPGLLERRECRLLLFQGAWIAVTCHRDCRTLKHTECPSPFPISVHKTGWLSQSPGTTRGLVLLE